MPSKARDIQLATCKDIAWAGGHVSWRGRTKVLRSLAVHQKQTTRQINRPSRKHLVYLTSRSALLLFQLSDTTHDLRLIDLATLIKEIHYMKFRHCKTKADVELGVPLKN